MPVPTLPGKTLSFYNRKFTPSFYLENSFVLLVRCTGSSSDVTPISLFSIITKKTSLCVALILNSNDFKENVKMFIHHDLFPGNESNLHVRKIREGGRPDHGLQHSWATQ